MKTNIALWLTALLAGPTCAAEVSLASAPPVIVQTTPAAGDTAVDPALTEIRVTYSKAMQDGRWSWSTWGEENYPETTGKPRYLADNRTCVLPVKLQPGKFYAIWLNSEKFKNFQDVNGQPAVPYLLTFFTGESGNSEPLRSDITAAEGVGAVVAQKIKSEVGRQIKQAGAKVDELLVTVAVARDSDTPFKITYRGLRNFKSSAGALVSPPDGEFVMNYIGSGQWQGALAGVKFMAQVGSVDKIDLPFVNDPQVIGQWESVDFVTSKPEFNPDKRAWAGNLFFKGVTFFENGRCQQPWLTWTKGVVMHSGNKTANRYEIKEIKGRVYLFFEWKSGDVTILGRKPSYYVLTKTAATDSAPAAVVASERVGERQVDKLIAEFPAGEDLSTPEGACAAWQRANARKDAQAISRLSLVPIEAKQQEAWYQREEARDSEGLAVYLKALADSKIVSVQTWRGELASVVAFLPFPEGKGRSPYSARTFGRVNGEWKNLGEDRLPTLEAAKANFEKKKETLWQQLQRTKATGRAQVTGGAAEWQQLLNEDQRVVLAWTDQQFRSYFDARTFAGWSETERTALEAKSIDALNGPRSRDYYQAINTLGALHSANGLPALRAIAYERADRNNRDRWMAIRSLGRISAKADVPELIHLVYHGNLNTRWWAQLALVQMTGQNFGKDWNAWAKWWKDQKGEPPYNPAIIRWWDGQAEPDKLAQSLEEGDQKFFADLKAKSAVTQTVSTNELVAKLRAAEPTMSGIRENWSASMTAMNGGDATNALVSLRQLAPHIQDFARKFEGTALGTGAAQALELVKSLTTALEKGDQDAAKFTVEAMKDLGRNMEEQIKTILEPANADDKQ